VLYMTGNHFLRRIQQWLLQELIHAFLEGRGVIYHQESFFEENSVVAVARAYLCLFLEGRECYISSEIIFQGEFSRG
jgi:hypothetical protein